MANMVLFRKAREALGFQQCKIFAVGAAPMHMGVHDYFMSINIPIMEVYGLSECSRLHTMNLIQQDRWRVRSCGMLINGVQLKIFNPNENGEGEVCCKVAVM